MDLMTGIVALIVGLIVGLLVGIFVLGKSAYERLNANRLTDAKQQADKIILDARATADRSLNEVKNEANTIKADAGRAKVEGQRIIQDAQRQADALLKTKELEAREKFLQRKAEFETDLNTRKQAQKEAESKLREEEAKLKQAEQAVTSRNADLAKKEEDIVAAREQLAHQQEVVARKRAELEKAQDEHLAALEVVAKLTQQEAKDEILRAVREKSQTEALSIVKESVDQAKLTASREAKKIVIQTIQRMSAEFTIENTVAVFPLDSDDLKGQIIGREGRNIRAFEAATGVEMVIDDTPEAVVISSFDPIRREVARVALQRLVADGRIHPARIEEVVTKVRKQIDEQIMEIGERTVLELNIHSLNIALVRMVGRMRFRASYGQNLLKHSIETANLCATMAAELGLNPKLAKMAKRAGLLHDIGKVGEEETELSHAILGMKLCEKYGEHAIICNAVGAHHDEIEMNNIISPIVQACDAISGARPGARREILESYIERIREMETVASSYDGVNKAYAIQAGRELRVMVESDKVDDKATEELAFAISQRIQNEMQYPGQVKVTVIRETRATAFAR